MGDPLKMKRSGNSGNMSWSRWILIMKQTAGVGRAFVAKLVFFDGFELQVLKSPHQPIRRVDGYYTSLHHTIITTNEWDQDQSKHPKNTQWSTIYYDKKRSNHALVLLRRCRPTLRHSF